MSERTPKKRWFCTYQSYRRTSKEERVAAKRDLRRGKEPAPQYRTGKLWND